MQNRDLYFDPTVLFERWDAQLALKENTLLPSSGGRRNQSLRMQQFFQIIKYKYNMHWPIGRHEQAANERLSDPHAQRHMLPILYWSDVWVKMELWAFRNVVVRFPFPLDLVDHIWVMVLMEMRSFHVLKYPSVFWKLCNGGWTHALLLPPVSMQKSIFNFLWEKWREWHEVSNVKSLVCCLLKCEYMMENAETHTHR